MFPICVVLLYSLSQSLEQDSREINILLIISHETTQSKKTESLHVKRLKLMACEVFKIVNTLSPEYIQDMINIKTSTYNFRSDRKVDIPRVNTTRYSLGSIRSEAPWIWNRLPHNLRKAESYRAGMALDVPSVPSFVLAFCLYVTALCSLLRFAVLLFMLKFYPLSHPSVQLSLKQFLLSRLPAVVKSCFYFSPCRFLKYLHVNRM